MIRLTKSVETPPSLLVVGNSTYNQQDVVSQLIEDHKGKCYLCERICITDYEIEHLKSSANKRELNTSWDNLFLSCSYCNRKKLQLFDNIVNPTTQNIEEIIQCVHLAENKNICFCSNELENQQVEETINLLHRIF